MLIGAHVPIGGGLLTAISHAQKLNIKTFQMFSSSPRVWFSQKRPAKEIDSFCAAVKKYHLGPVFIHAKYLVNLGSPSSEVVEKSIQSLIFDMQFCASINGAGVIFHIGSSRGAPTKHSLKSIVKSCQTVLSQTPATSTLILENSAGAGYTIGSRLDEISFLLNKIGSQRAGFCFDTCHAFASGYDLHTKADIDKLMDKIGQLITFDKLLCIHANDSKNELGSKKDRHENIGQGYIGSKGFKYLLQHPRLKDKPFIIETPSLKEGKAQKDLDVLRALAVS